MVRRRKYINIYIKRVGMQWVYIGLVILVICFDWLVLMLNLLVNIFNIGFVFEYECVYCVCSCV